MSLSSPRGKMERKSSKVKRRYKEKGRKRKMRAE
jgi:hypothetical protein